jgi:hypothetical protein
MERWCDVSKESAFKLLIELDMTEVEAELLRLMIDDPRFVDPDEKYATREDLQEMLDFIRKSVPEEHRRGAKFGAN